MIMWYAWSPAAQLGQSLNLMHKENHALQSYAFREVLLYVMGLLWSDLSSEAGDPN